MRVVTYRRVSTEEQAASGLGLEAQAEILTGEVGRRGWSLMESITDDGYTGARLDRPGITHALELLRTGKADVLMVAKLDRLSRSLLDFAGLMEQARAEGWSLVALDLGVDLTTPAGEMLASVLASFAQYERRLIGQRTRDAMRALKARGVRLGRPVELPSVVRRRIARERAAGRTLEEIATRLTADGVPTARGGSWSRASVLKVCRSVELDAA